ncbi:MAG: helix-turn-helix domain-containing protein, partial [Ignavibacteria bacterium]|nr:helix-turn-helix domain-containing protein [Ignavibacteria bacterium]
MFDKSPNEFIRSYRLYNAVIKIKEDGASVSEAAFSVGFNSLPYFSKCFQQEFGYLPSEILNKD